MISESGAVEHTDFEPGLSQRVNGAFVTDGLDTGINKAILPPGNFRLIVDWSFTRDYPVTPYPAPKPFPAPVSLCLKDFYIDGTYVKDGSSVEGFLGEERGIELYDNYVSTSSIPGSYEGRLVRTVFEIDKANVFDIFVDFIQFVVDTSGPTFIELTVHDVRIIKNFAVRTNMGIDDDYNMVLPIAETGTMTDMRLSRVLIPSYREEFMERFLRRAEEGYHARFIPPELRYGALYDKVNAKIENYIGETVFSSRFENILNINTRALDLRPSRGDLDNAPFMTEVPLRNIEGSVSDLNYVLDVDASGGFTGHAFALSYYWLAIDHIGEVMTTMPGANMYQHWMPDFSITANKTISAIEDTALGDMLYGDLEDWYEPAWSANTTALDEYDRRFIHYASLSSDTPTTYVSPLSFQADSEGGGVINYGLSCQIDIDFIISNSSIPSVLSEVLARSNSMNMWGHNQVDNPILDANLSYYFHDTLTIYRQEGMLEEFLQQITRIPFMAVAALFGGELPDWYANGICDTYAVPGMINVPDYDGPLWYPEGMYRDDGKQEPYVQIMNMFDEGVLLRPAVLETSGWDKISSPDDHFLRWAIPAPEIRGQVLRAQNITIGLDWVELDRSSVYVEAMIQSSDLDSEPVWKNVTIQQNNDLFIDLADISGDANGMNLWDSSPETIGEKYFTSPVVLIFVYEAKPSDDDDIIRRVNNLLYSDSVYLRADLDYGYLAQYRQKLREQEANALAMRLALLAAGGIQIGLGISLAGKSLGSSIVMCFWGLEYIVQGLFGRSMMDIALHTILRAAGMDKEQAESWSLWHLFSDPTLDLIAQEVMANLISAGLGGLSAKKLTEGEGILTRLTTWLDGRQGFVSGATRRLLSAINCVIDRVKKFIGRHEWIKQLWIPTYFLGEAVWEAIYELAFEAVDDTSTPAQYIIGPELILFTTLLMVGASLAEGMVFGGTGSMSRTWLAAAVALRVIAFIPTIAVLRYWDVDIGY